MRCGSTANVRPISRCSFRSAPRSAASERGFRGRARAAESAAPSCTLQPVLHIAGRRRSCCARGSELSCESTAGSVAHAMLPLAMPTQHRAEVLVVPGPSALAVTVASTSRPGCRSATACGGCAEEQREPARPAAARPRRARRRLRRHRHLAALRDQGVLRRRSTACRRPSANVLGILSLVFWSLTLVVVVKYLTFVMRADNHGEGGILALLALVHARSARGRPALGCARRCWRSSARRCSTATA